MDEGEGGDDEGEGEEDGDEGDEKLRASFLIVRRCTAVQWETHQSCLLVEQNNIVTAAATSAERHRKNCECCPAS